MMRAAAENRESKLSWFEREFASREIETRGGNLQKPRKLEEIYCIIYLLWHLKKDKNILKSGMQ
jgi:hypothetical protein